MHYIIKNRLPDCFESDVSDFTSSTLWEEFKNPCKLDTRKHILDKEQYGLCIYCERKVELSETRLEHLKPQSQYPEDRFNYSNLVISCDGKDYCSPETTALKNYDIDSCDHYKDKYFDINKFLNPLEVNNIDEYFEFDCEDGSISASSKKDLIKAEYMIDLLNLCNPALCTERVNARKAFFKAVNPRLTVNRKRLTMSLLRNNNQAFISFLRYCFIS